MHKDGRRLDKLDRIVKLIASWANRIVMKNCCQEQDKLYGNAPITSQLLQCADMLKVAIWTNQIVLI